MPLVAGVDTSTQSCKIVVRDAETGALVRSGSAQHPDGTEIHPDHWWTAFTEAARAAGGLDDVAAIAVGGQQHGLVALDAEGNVVRDALLWNDTRSAPAAEDLIRELGEGDRETGAQRWADATGSVLVASLTITKLRWLRDAEPDNAARVAAVALPHDWLTWRIAGYGPAGESPLGPDLTALCTDRSDASGTGYYDAEAPADDGAPGTLGAYRRDLLALGFGRDDVVLPRVLAPSEPGGVAHPSVAGSAVEGGALLGPGAGDNAGASLGLGMGPGDIAISIGTSGVVSAVAPRRTADGSGAINGFADATGNALMLAVTLNAARVLDAARTVLDTDFDGLARLALSAPPGADGLVLVPYLEGERTPNRPDATGTLHGLRLATSTREHLARAYVEGMLCGLADGLDALRAQGVPVERVMLIGGAAQSPAVQEIAPQVFGVPISIPAAGEYVADGAARQAAWVLAAASDPDAAAPSWSTSVTATLEADPRPVVREQYAAVRDLV
ncbi:xylulokinase [Isoptericola sp. CG 20/1183]|uniref:Xylulose kinase n=1 Tax=Isoptericola halotolerans TaxID=300560 RepID=A0ABX5ED76_9MICO|nr:MULTISPECIES: FGGY family carbohydrate kinase [Isoptericola]PRZ06354.1 xylulokinase [Isoptericola halotolerans]PRZ06840.1 xylulokinase [Isoptericola sp. CG 20/1183]